MWDTLLCQTGSPCRPAHSVLNHLLRQGAPLIHQHPRPAAGVGRHGRGSVQPHGWRRSVGVLLAGDLRRRLQIPKRHGRRFLSDHASRFRQLLGRHELTLGFGLPGHRALHVGWQVDLSLTPLWPGHNMPAVTSRTCGSAVTCGVLVGSCLFASLAAAPRSPAPESRPNQTEPQDVEAFRLAAEQGDAEAQYKLGVIYSEGKGVPQDAGEAVRWYWLAADQGHAGGQNVIGEMYAYGEGVAQDDAEALRWFRLAADQLLARAQYNLGVLYENGRSVVAKDDAEAARWFRLAADNGFADAQFLVGLMFFLGRGVPQDEAEGVRWLRLAAERGHVLAQFNLGVAYDGGGGIQEDDVEAARWFRLAADQGYAAAQNGLGNLYRQ